MWFRHRRDFIRVHDPREKDALRIVADGAIAHPEVGEGRLIPLVILDTSNRADLAEYIRIHQYIRAGDVRSQWGQVIGHKNTVALVLSFSQPSELIAIVEFDLDRNHGVLIEHVLAVRALYLQAGHEGDRLKHDVNAPKVIIEVPELGFGDHWKKIHLTHMTASLRKRGLSRRDASKAAQLAIDQLRKAIVLRVPS